MLLPEYQLLTKNLAEATAKVAQNEKNYQTKKEELQKAAPQTSILHFARDHYFQAKAQLAKSKQELRSLEFSLAHFKHNTKVEYQKYWELKKEWPPKDAHFDVQGYLKLKNAKSDWDPKSRMPSAEPTSKSSH